MLDERLWEYDLGDAAGAPENEPGLVRDRRSLEVGETLSATDQEWRGPGETEASPERRWGECLTVRTKGDPELYQNRGIFCPWLSRRGHRVCHLL